MTNNKNIFKTILVVLGLAIGSQVFANPIALVKKEHITAAVDYDTFEYVIFLEGNKNVLAIHEPFDLSEAGCSEEELRGALQFDFIRQGFNEALAAKLDPQIDGLLKDKNCKKSKIDTAVKLFEKQYPDSILYKNENELHVKAEL